MPSALLTLALAAFAVAPSAARGEGRLLQVAHEVPLDEGAARWAGLYEGWVVAQTNEREIRAIDPATGLVRWRYTAAGAPIRRIERRTRQLVVIAQDLQIVSLADGTVDWTYPLGCRPDGTCQLTPIGLDDQRLYLMGFAGAPDSLMVVDLVSRDEAWPTWAQVGPIARADVSESVILVAADDGRTVTAVDRGMGRVLWKTTLPNGAGAAGAVPARLWADDAGAYVWRAVPNGAGPSRIDVLGRKDGAATRAVTSVTCSRGLDGCGVFPGKASAVVWDAARAATGGVGHIMVHDLVSGTSPVDTQAYLIGPPVTALERLAVFGDRRGGRVHLEARRLPDGAEAWSKRCPELEAASGAPPRVTLAVAGGVVYAIFPEAGRVTGLALGDGAMAAFGEIDLAGEEVRNVFLDGESLLLTTDRRVLAVVGTPIDELAAELKKALGSGETERAQRLDAMIVRLARQFEAAAAAHGVMIRYAFLVAGHAFATGGGPGPLEAAREHLRVASDRSVAPLVAAATAINNLLVDVLFNAPDGFPEGTTPQLEALADTYAEQLDLIAAPLKGAPENARDRIRAAGLDLVEALARADRPDGAVRLLGALARAPVDLTPSALPSPARYVIAQTAAASARQAGTDARARRVDQAVERLVGVLDLPFAEVVIPAHDASRLQIQVWRDGLETPQRREVAALAKEAARAWASIGQPRPDGQLECFEACQRRRLTCERPCVDAASCQGLLRACADACDRTGNPFWTGPETTPPRTDPTFPQKCL